MRLFAQFQFKIRATKLAKSAKFGLKLGKISYIFFDSINFQDFLSHRKELIVISICWNTDVPQGGDGNFPRK